MHEALRISREHGSSHGEPVHSKNAKGRRFMVALAFMPVRRLWCDCLDLIGWVVRRVYAIIPRVAARPMRRLWG